METRTLMCRSCSCCLEEKNLSISALTSPCSIYFTTEFVVWDGVRLLPGENPSLNSMLGFSRVETKIAFPHSALTISTEMYYDL